MYCNKCGGSLEDGVAFCPYCGNKVTTNANMESDINNMNNQGSYDTNYYNQNNGYAPNNAYAPNNFNSYQNVPNNIPEYYQPIGMWGYFLYEILFSIPIVGFILEIIFAITAKNKNLKNFAIALLIMQIIFWIVIIILFASGINIFRGMF